MSAIRSVYVAGPMRGYPRLNFDAFDEARDQLKLAGYRVITPADLDRAIGFDPDQTLQEPFDLAAAVRRDVEAITSVDAVVLLPGHEKSVGATAERHVAKWAGKPVLLYPSLTPFEE